jgi:hypothetical protein
LHSWLLSCRFLDQAKILIQPFGTRGSGREDLVASYPGRREAGDRGCAVTAIVAWWLQFLAWARAMLAVVRHVLIQAPAAGAVGR